MTWVEEPVRASWFSSGPGHSTCGHNKLKNSGYFAAFQYLTGYGQITGDCQAHELSCGADLIVTARCASVVGRAIGTSVWSHGPECRSRGGYCNGVLQRSEPVKVDLTPAAFKALSVNGGLGAGFLPVSLSYYG